MWLRSFTRAFLRSSLPAALALGLTPTLSAQAPPPIGKLGFSAALSADNTDAVLPLGLEPGTTAPPACSDRDWLAVVPAKRQGIPALKASPIACPTVSCWRSEPLFDSSSSLRGPLFCRYAWAPSRACPRAPRRDDMKRLTDNAHLRGTVRLCAVLGPLGAAGGLDPELLYRELRFQVGATDLPLTTGQAPGVQLAVVDTQPTGTGAPAAPGSGGSAHGFGIAHIARDLTCGTAGCDSRQCAAAITTRLALPLSNAADPPSPGESQGGFFGRPSDIALAIVREVDAWAAPGNPPRLILNLSVGWDPELLHDDLHAEDGDHLNAEELAVYAALAYARQQGALAVAAAGNSPGGSQPGQGALLPARWYAAPPDTQGLVTAADDPVVWAIGAVDRNERPLANVRAGSLPTLVAYGDHADAPAPGSGWTDPLTGSSVSAIVASSIAAVVWHLQPNLSPDDVMLLLARSARPLERQAELYRPGSSLASGSAMRQSTAPPPINPPAPPVKLLQFAAALSRAWSRPQLYGDQMSFAASGTATARVGCSSCTQRPCGSGSEPIWICTFTDLKTGLSWGPPAGCPPGPFRSIASLPWVLPQPGQDPCPTCSISSGTPPPPRMSFPVDPAQPPSPPQPPWELDLEIPSSWGGGCLTDFLVEVAVPGSSSPDKLWIVPPQGQLCQGDSLLVTDLPFDPGEATASVSFKIQGKSSLIRSPAYVGWKP